jgi:HPP family
MKGISAVGPPLLAAVVLALIGVLGMLAGVPWLFPSLGPSVITQVGSPSRPEARPSHVLVGHLIGTAAAYIAVYVTGAASAPAVGQSHVLSFARVGAAVLAVFLSAVVQRLAGKRHAPAESTTLLVALGSMEPTLRTAITIVSGVALVSVLGEGARRLALAQARRARAEGNGDIR